MKKKRESCIYSQRQYKQLLALYSNGVPWHQMIGQHGLNKAQVLRFHRQMKDKQLPRRRSND